jgi:hypothetical protein
LRETSQQIPIFTYQGLGSECKEEKDALGVSEKPDPLFRRIWREVPISPQGTFDREIPQHGAFVLGQTEDLPRFTARPIPDELKES